MLKAIAYQSIYTRVAKKMKLTPSHVRRVARGERESAPVMNVLLGEISAIEQRFAPSDAVRTSPATAGHETQNGTSPADPFESLSLRRAELRALMDVLDQQMDTRHPDSVCPICGCTSDNRCAVPEGRFGFTRCGWDHERGICSSPFCAARTQEAAPDDNDTKTVVVACHGEAQAVKKWLDAGGLQLVEDALRKRQHDMMGRAFRDATETHRWRPIPDSSEPIIVQPPRRRTR
jgi:hypothetical protein